MIPVFFSSTNHGGELRYFMRGLCWLKWTLEPEADLIYLTPAKADCDENEFQWVRRKYAEDNRASEFYILADDDCLPITPHFILRGLNILREHDQFAILGLNPRTCHEWLPEDNYKVISDSAVFEQYSVGGIRFCRRGCMKSWPVFTGPGYDEQQCLALRSMGWRVGYFRDLTMNHIGEGYTTVWNQARV